MRSITWMAIIWFVGGLLVMGLVMNTSNQCVSPTAVVEKTAFIPVIWLAVLAFLMVKTVATMGDTHGNHKLDRS
jgi:hypothetical protein